MPIALAVLIYSGQLKANPLLNWIPVDLTILATLTVSVFALFSLGGAAIDFRSATVFWIVTVALVSGSFALSPTAYASTKVATLFTVTLVGLLVAPRLILTNLQRQWILIWTIFAIGLFISVYSLLLPQSAAEGSDRLVFEGTDTIGTARLAAASLLVALCIVASRPQRKRVAALTLWLSIPLLGGVLVLTGSRGPLLSLVVAAGVLTVMSAPFRAGIRRYAAVLVTGGALALLWLSSTGSDGLDRLLRSISGVGDNSTAARALMWETAFQSILESPMGVGWGGFHAAMLREGVVLSSELVYPHNIFLELLLEAGWLPGAAVIAAILYVVGSAVLRAKEPLSIVVAALLLFSLANAMVSGDLNSARLLWATIALALVIRDDSMPTGGGIGPPTAAEFSANSGRPASRGMRDFAPIAASWLLRGSTAAR